MSLQGKHIVLGITGSIAAYKSCTLVRLLIKAGAEVQVVITPSGKEFVTPITLSALTSKAVVSDFFSQRDGTWHSHVDLGLWADAMVIAPATASSIGKMAHGIADNMLITTYLSMKAPVFVAPAMDLDMYQHASTQRNIAQLESDGCTIIEAQSGELASHLVGKGRMEEPERIVEVLSAHFSEKGQLQGKRVLLTAGPTYERIDPVRFIGNFSSGKMGFALAEYCAEQGAHVDLVAGPVSLQTRHAGIRRYDVESAQEMYERVMSLLEAADIVILAAAVADFTLEAATEKLKKTPDSKGLTLQLVTTHDIAAEVGQRKRKNQHVVGFALETHDEESNARGKLERKNFDFIVLNSLRDASAGFQYDTNKVTLISRDEEVAFGLKSKSEVAKDIIDYLCEHYDI